MTHDKNDFRELHEAWVRWSRRWGIESQHGGIVVLPSRPVPIIEVLLFELIDADVDLEGRLYIWRQSTGWQEIVVAE